MATKTVILKIYGSVQGVGFRYYAHRKAYELGISGYVMNRPDGSVYVEAESEENNLELFIRWCEEGPPWARVSKVEKQFVPGFGFEGFQIK